MSRLVVQENETRKRAKLDMRKRVELELAGFWKQIRLPSERVNKYIPNVEVRKYSRAEFKYLTVYIREFKRIIDRITKKFVNKDRKYIVTGMKGARYDPRVDILEDKQFEKWTNQFSTDAYVTAGVKDINYKDDIISRGDIKKYNFWIEAALSTFIPIVFGEGIKKSVKQSSVRTKGQNGLVLASEELRDYIYSLLNNVTLNGVQLLNLSLADVGITSFAENHIIFDLSRPTLSNILTSLITFGWIADSNNVAERSTTKGGMKKVYDTFNVRNMGSNVITDRFLTMRGKTNTSELTDVKTLALTKMIRVRDVSAPAPPVIPPKIVNGQYFHDGRRYEPIIDQTSGAVSYWKNVGTGTTKYDIIPVRYIEQDQQFDSWMFRINVEAPQIESLISRTKLAQIVRTQTVSSLELLQTAQDYEDMDIYKSIATYIRKAKEPQTISTLVRNYIKKTPDYNNSWRNIATLPSGRQSFIRKLDILRSYPVAGILNIFLQNINRDTEQGTEPIKISGIMVNRLLSHVQRNILNYISDVRMSLLLPQDGIISNFILPNFSISYMRDETGNINLANSYINSISDTILPRV